MRRPIAALLIPSLLTGAASADTIRTTTTYQPLAYTPAAIIAADLNADGRDDPIVFATNPNRYQIFLSQPDGTFQPQPIVTLEGNTIGPVRKADLNNDGREDIVFLAPSNSSFYILLNTGNGTLTQPPSSPVPTVTSPQTFALADTNEDGITDIIVGYPSRVAIHPGLPGAQFGVAGSAVTLPATNIGDIAFADLTGDKIPQIAALSSNSVYILNRVSGAYTLGPTIALSNTGFRISAGDTNADGIAELIVPVLNRVGVIVCRYNQDTGAYNVITPPGTLPTINSSDVAFGDINSNGRIDLALANTGSSAARLYYSTTGAAPIFREVDQAIGEFFELRFAAFLDANADGRTDIAYASTSPNALMLLTQDGFGTFRANGFNQTLSVTPTRIARMPDNQGNPAFLVGHAGSSVLVRATLVPEFTGFAIQQDGLAETAGGTSQGGWHVTDINADGLPDIVYTAVQSSIARFRWQLGNPDGTFSPVLNRPVSDASALNTPVVADFNHDGLADIAALTNTGTVAISYGQLSGFLSPAVIHPMTPTTTPGSLLAADLDADGYTDLICSNRQTGSNGAIFVAYARPDGTFEPAVSFPTIANAGSTNLGLIDAADINADGYLDIAIGSPNGLSVVHLSTGPRSYSAAQTVSNGTNLSQVSLVDLDADGYPEVVTTYRGYTETATRNGVGFFETRSAFLHAQSVANAHYEDFNADGLPDMIYASANGVSVLYNRSVPRCIPDHNADGNVDLFDIAAFIRDYNAASPLVDLNADGRIDFFDLARFIQAFTLGCP